MAEPAPDQVFWVTVYRSSIALNPYTIDLFPSGDLGKLVGTKSSQDPQLGLRRLNSQMEAFIETSRNGQSVQLANEYVRPQEMIPDHKAQDCTRTVLPTCQPACGRGSLGWGGEEGISTELWL